MKFDWGPVIVNQKNLAAIVERVKKQIEEQEKLKNRMKVIDPLDITLLGLPPDPIRKAMRNMNKELRHEIMSNHHEIILRTGFKVAGPLLPKLCTERKGCKAYVHVHWCEESEHVKEYRALPWWKKLFAYNPTKYQRKS